MTGRADRTIIEIAKDVGVDIPQYRSQLNTNHLKRNIREVVGTQGAKGVQAVGRIWSTGSVRWGITERRY